MKTILSTVLVLVASAVSFNATAAGNIEAGKAATVKFNCAACHGPDFNSPIDPSYPKLAGQHKDYLAHALTAYHRGNGPNGRGNPIMGGQAQQLSHQDIQNIAAYLHSLPSGLVLKK